MRTIRIALTLLILAAALSVAYAVIAELGLLEPEAIPNEIPADAEMALVDWVYDGDTIEALLPDGSRETVRLTGIDAPETGANTTPVQCYGQESTVHLRALLPAGTTVWMDRDISNRDRYGRLVRFIWTSDQGSALLVNLRMLEDGFAFARSYGDDREHEELFRKAASTADEADLGMWGACPSYQG
ncbi:MAG: thermonuclease family protein [Thermomicrobiales bacterium]